MNTGSYQADHGTIELRSRHRTQEVPTELAGITAMLITDECLLDKLLHSKKLGPLDADGKPLESTARRYQAGLWLRALYEKAGMRKRVTMAYSVFGQAGSPEEMSDAEAWNWRCWRDTMRDLGMYGHLLLEVCCLDKFHSKAHVWRGLDRLADLRTILSNRPLCPASCRSLT